MSERLTYDIAADLRGQADLSDATNDLLCEAADKLEGLLDLLVMAETDRDDARALLLRLVEAEDGPCHLDHHGYCQMHGLHSPPCAVRAAREFLEI
jgi:hypothetical protein